MYTIVYKPIGVEDPSPLLLAKGKSTFDECVSVAKKYVERIDLVSKKSTHGYLRYEIRWSPFQPNIISVDWHKPLKRYKNRGLAGLIRILDEEQYREFIDNERARKLSLQAMRNDNAERKTLWDPTD